ncbi:hypothetical protein K3152_08720 [Qipengyuania sp. 1NDH17]|uniref:Core-binding (CB) domain-containing protein n=1 Tax=Qipengyuania polymorpha TaxID=2867234 RepID=A0ABS7IXP0_9SPHN|nr:hypothetical protein [Qipengyuania polymorpha]MBX7458326.1 hypothetical protein [Qipengyuania polymorpha]
MAKEYKRLAQIRAIVPRDKPFLTAQGGVENLYINTSPKRKQVWRWQTVIKGRTVKKTLGPIPQIEVNEAKKLAMELNDRREAGEPLVEPEKPAALGTFQEFAEAFLEAKRFSGKGLKTIAEYERILRGHIYPVCGDKPMGKLTREDMDAVIDPIRQRGAGVMSNRVLAILRPIIKKAVARDILEKDLTSQIDKFHEAKNKSNERALSIDELAKLWRAAEDLDDKQRDALRLLILTACRRNEVVAAATADYDGRLWTIPAAEFIDERGHTFPVSHTKNNKPHPLQLGPVGKTILDANNGGEHFFTDGQPHRFMWPDFLTKARAALRAHGHRLPAWDLRAIRRGVRTAVRSKEMKENGHIFLAEHGEMLLNHTKPELEGTYDKNDFAYLIGDVLLAWEELLMTRVKAQLIGRVLSSD